ncbi:alpha/beta hydrolase [Streptomyces sp. NPDC018833]|uniref:alpha/beta hydrolase n=1 Tax=Streptomyces sp. NPDC018833 TaxID=3365053 RepID=UPI0037A5A98A
MGPRHHAPLLVVNPSHDPSTPYRAGQAMAAELDGARLLTLDGYGHTALDNPSTCVKRHVVRYFLTGALPPQDARCPQDTPPFAAPAEREQSPAGTAATGRSTGAGKAGTPSGTVAPKGAVRFPVWPLRSADLFPAWPTGPDRTSGTRTPPSP